MGHDRRYLLRSVDIFAYRAPAGNPLAHLSAARQLDVFCYECRGATVSGYSASLREPGTDPLAAPLVAIKIVPLNIGALLGLDAFLIAWLGWTDRSRAGSLHLSSSALYCSSGYS